MLRPCRRRSASTPRPLRGLRLYILGTLYLTMATAGYVVEVLFGALGIIPESRNVAVIAKGPAWNYTAVLNIIFLAIAAALVLRFLRTGGPRMLRMMSVPEGEMAAHPHEHALGHGHGG